MLRLEFRHAEHAACGSFLRLTLLREGGSAHSDPAPVLGQEQSLLLSLPNEEPVRFLRMRIV